MAIDAEDDEERDGVVKPKIEEKKPKAPHNRNPSIHTHSESNGRIHNGTVHHNGTQNLLNFREHSHIKNGSLALSPKETALLLDSFKYEGVDSQLGFCGENKSMASIPPPLRIDYEFQGITFCVKDNEKKKEKKGGLKTILEGTSGKFLSCQLTAIMGPSGAGKTTLMNILAGYKMTKVSGKVLVNGREREMKSFKRKSCYIMQTDHLLPYLTVYETMKFAAEFKLGDEVPKKTKKDKINVILEDLNLKNSSSTRVSNLSGGEKKRLSIATELVSNPPIMFFDEPTSGLDSRNTYQCISLLKDLAQGGRTIVCTIHQPSSKIFEMFDSLYAMADGKCIYKGPTRLLQPTLSSLGLECPPYHNPADYLMEVASGEYGKQNISRLEASATYNKELGDSNSSAQTQSLDLVPSKHDEQEAEANEETQIQIVYSQPERKIPDYPSSVWTQFSVLFERTFLSIIRDMMLTQLRLGAHVIVGLFVGALYYMIGNEASKVFSNTGYIFFCLMLLLFTAMMPTILTFPLEMDVFKKEHLNNWYSLKAYYLAKTMADLPFQIIFPIIYVSIVYFMTGQPINATTFLLFNYFCIMMSLVSQSLGLAIGAALDVQQAIFLGPTISIVPLIFSGFFVTFPDIPIYLRWITYLSFIRYTFEGSLIITYGLGREPLHCSESFCYLRYPKKVLEQFGIEENFLLCDILLLALYFVIMRIFGYFVLRWRLRRNR